MRFKLTFPKELADKPVFSEAILRFHRPFNIIEADVDAEKGVIVASTDLPEDDVMELVKFFEERGVRVELLAKLLEVDLEKCISCGACVSLCPVEAISIARDWSVVFDEEKCVACGLCVNACPVRALKLSIH
ncbi:MAG: 4Fe-4S binding protein [Candidatus Bathyarchaeia archaeon]|nr:4Fe-4S binding protein [Candidatus Bathyarchaeota archaeon]